MSENKDSNMVHYGFDPSKEDHEEGFRIFMMRANAYAQKKGFLGLLEGTNKVSKLNEL
jgi:hypothetical protein